MSKAKKSVYKIETGSKTFYIKSSIVPIVSLHIGEIDPENFDNDNSQVNSGDFGDVGVIAEQIKMIKSKIVNSHNSININLTGDAAQALTKETK